MHNFKAMLRCLIFIIILIICLNSCRYMFLQPTYTRAIIHELNSEDENYDLILLGESHSWFSLNPYVFDGILGSNAINLSIPNETMKDSYYLLKESCRTNDVKTVILEMDYQYWYEENYEEFIYDRLPLSKVKLEYFTDRLLNRDFRFSMSKWSYYINDFKDVKSNIAIKRTEDYANYKVSGTNVGDVGGPYVGKGFFSRRDGIPDELGIIANGVWNEKVNQKTLKYFNQIVNYCKKNNINLILVTSTIPDLTVYISKAKDSSKYFTELAKKYDLQYYDFNLAKYDIMPRNDLSFIDWDGHMGGTLANKFSFLFASAIKEQKDNKLNKEKYFYSSYEELLSNMPDLLYVGSQISTEKVDNKNKVIISTERVVKENPEVEFKIQIRDDIKNEIIYSTEYEKKYLYNVELDNGNYTVTVKAREEGEETEKVSNQQIVVK